MEPWQITLLACCSEDVLAPQRAEYIANLASASVSMHQVVAVSQCV